MVLFREYVLQSPLGEDYARDVLSVLETVILDMIKMERNGELIDRSLIRSCCYMLEGLYTTLTEEEDSKLYLTSFEPKFLESSQAFYRSEGERYVENGDASTFCLQARKRLREEEQRCYQTISLLTEMKIKSVVEHEFIQRQIRTIINMEGTGVKHMLDNDRVADLANVYDLVVRVDHRRVALKEAVQKRVIDLGTEINKSASLSAAQPTKPIPTTAETQAVEKPSERSLNQQTANAITWVEEVLKLKAKYDRIWEEAFKKDAVMEKALEVSFQDFINNNTQSSEYLSLFLDEYLKNGTKSQTESEIDVLLDKGLILLQYIADKDRFELYYKKHMAKRLLMKRSSKDMERQMVSKMKTKIGSQITQRLEAMTKDVSISEDLATQYREFCANSQDLDARAIDIEARIITSNVWPFDHLAKGENEDGTPQLPCIYPPEIERLRERYQKLYLEKHNGRRLTWMPALGDADVRLYLGENAKGKARRHELNVSTYGMIILLLFNDVSPDTGLTMEEIMAQTNIPRYEAIRNLQSLAVAAKRSKQILRKEPMSRDVKPDDKFFFNDKFESQFFKIKVGVVAGTNRVENDEERRETQKKADEARGHVIEAAIVRIMKQRKTLGHAALMAETLQQLSSRFQPDVNMVKKKIEALIDREYLERGSDPAKPEYNYLA